MEIKLSKLIIKTFKGIEFFELNIAGENATIIGRNATGKTSVADAFYWLLTGSNLEQKSKFGIIKDGHEQAEVEAEIFIGSKLIKTKKIYHPVLKNDMVTGFTTDHFIDDVYLQKKEYDQEMASLQEIRLVSDINYFMSVPVAKRRELLFSLVKSVKDSDIIATYPDLEPVKEILNGHDFTRVKKTLESQKKKLEESNKEIPIEIRTHRSMMPAGDLANEGQIRSQIDALDTQLAEIKHGGKLVKRIALLEAESIGLESDIKKQYEKTTGDLFDRKLELKKQIINNNEILTESKSELDIKNRSLADFEMQMENLYKQWQQENAMSYEPSKFCYACKQPLPDDQITRQIDEFNQERAESLKQIDLSGKELRNNIDNLEKIINVKLKLIASVESKNTVLEDDLKAVEVEIAQIENKIAMEIDTKKRAISEQINDLKTEDQSTDLYKLESERSKLENELIKIVQAQKTKAAIKKLETKQREINGEIEDVARCLYLLHEFNRKKAEFIEGKISSKFAIVDWKLFELHLNGNLRDICEPYFDNIPYLDLNTGAKANIGLDICSTFSRHLKTKCTLFVDNSESITDWIPIDSQVIRLRATKNGDKLNYEVNNA